MTDTETAIYQAAFELVQKRGEQCFLALVGRIFFYFNALDCHGG